MSHELRTPLNSLLILSDQLCKNQDGNLTNRQVEFSKTIHSSGNDLLMLINDILDLSKIESGTVAVDVSEVRIDDLHRSIERSFRHFAESKHLDFSIHIEQPLPKSLVTDVKRLQQIIKNLLSNAFKFTHQGYVSFSISAVDGGWTGDQEELRNATRVIAFSVADTGIGISPDKGRSSSRFAGRRVSAYGGTGSASRSTTSGAALGGEIRSTTGLGSTFALPAPELQPGAAAPPAARVDRERPDPPATVTATPERQAAPAPSVHRHGDPRRPVRAQVRVAEDSGANHGRRSRP
jgi:signal transduction histidine kinase